MLSPQSYDPPVIHHEPPQALRIPVTQLAEPYFITERNTLLLPCTAEWRDIAEVCEHRVIQLPTPSGGVRLYAIRNTPLLVHLMGGAGIELPSPILSGDYDWSGQVVYLSQEITAGLMVANRRAYILNGMGTGKTLATLLALDYLLTEGVIDRVLVVAPRSVLWRVWEKEIQDRMPRLRPVVLYGDRTKRLKLLRSANWNVAIINNDGVRVIANELHHEGGFGALVIDELALYRERKTERWGLMEALVNRVDFAWGLTGAPTPNGPWDAYGQIRLLTPWQVPGSFKSFRDKVAIESYPGVWLPRKGSQAVVHQLMQPAIRYTRAEVMELPPSQTITHHVELSKPQAEAARVLIKDLILQFDQGKVKGTNAAVLLGKLLQIYSGAVYTDSREVIDLKPTDRVELTRELMAEAEGKAIVFVPYRHLCDLLPRMLNFPDGQLNVVHGGTSDRDRTNIFANFQDRNAPVRYLLAHPKCMAHGLNLTAANTVIWYAPYTSHEITAQANERITRAGQEREQVVYRLTAAAAENKIYRTLDSRGSMQDAILDLFEQQFN